MRIFACFPTHNAQEKSRTRLSHRFSPFIEKLSLTLSAFSNTADASNTHLMANMTYTLTAAQKAKLTREGRKAANKALWALEKEHRKMVAEYRLTDKEAFAQQLRVNGVMLLFDKLSQTHSKPVTHMAAKPMEAKAESVSAKSLKCKSRKGPKDSNGKLEAQAQAQSLRMAQTRAAKSVKTEVVEDIKGYRTEVEVTPKNPRKAHTFTQTWIDFSEVPAGLTLEDAVRYAALQDGYGQAADEVSLDDCL